MKKIVLSTAIVFLLISGYFVGINELGAEKDSQKASPSTYRNQDGLVGVRSDAQDIPGINDSNSSSQDSGFETSKSGSETKNGLTEQAPQSNIGDPLSKYIVKTGTIDITIDKNSLTKNYVKVVLIIKKDGGYIQSNDSTLHSAVITVRIPSDKLDEQLVALRELGTVTGSSLDSFDESYNVKDYTARLAILEQRKAVLLVALEKATPNSALDIQQQIFDVQSDIENTKGQQELLNEQISLSTITVTLTEKGETSSAQDEGSKSILGKSWDKSSKSLLTSLGGIVIILGATFPFIILFGLIILIVKTIVNRKNIKKSSQEG